MARRKGVFGSVYCRPHGPKCRGDRAGCSWYVRVRNGEDGGRGDFRKHVGPTKSVAEAKLASMRLSLETEGNLGIRPPCLTTLDGFLPEYLPLLRKRVSPTEATKGEAKLKRAAASLSGPMEKVGRADAETFLGTLKGAGCTAATVNRYQAALSMAWRAAVDRGVAAANPWRGIPRGREAEKPTRWIPPSNLQRIALAAPPAARPVVTFDAETGLRLSEVLALEWADLDIPRKVVIVSRSLHSDTTKSGLSREVPLTDLALEVLGRLPRKGPRVFADAPSPGWFSHYFPAWAKAGGEEGATFHDLRHSFGSGLAQAGVPIPTIMRLMGHASIEVTMRYARHAPADAGARAIRALERSRRPRTPAGKGTGKGSRLRRATPRRRRSPSKTGT